MGSGNSHHQTAAHYLDPPMIHEPPPAPYPDMNMIFKSIPKMMQVADDMHRMSNYIMDLRNMMFACSVFSMIGIFMFLLMKYMHGRRKGATRRRQRRNHNNHRSDDSEQSSLSIGRPMIGGGGVGGGGAGGGSSSGYRHYHAARPVDGWAAHAAALSGSGGGTDGAPPRVMVDSTSTRHTHIGTPLHGGVASTTAPLLMNTTPSRGAYAVPSLEHHQQGYQQQQNNNNHYSTQQQQQQYAMAAAMRDSSPQHNQSPATPISPTTSSATGAGATATTTPNGQLKVVAIVDQNDNNAKEERDKHCLIDFVGTD